MVTAACPTLVIAGTGSGVGKTSLALGVVRELARRGLRVQTFKVGPDFLDPTYLTLASGRTCYNLDGWMTSRQYVCELFAQATADADAAVIEGVMGMFDGASPTGLEGSTAEIAGWLGAAVVLVAGAHGAARSLAATVQGFARFEPSVPICGAIANQCGSARHRAWLAESLAAAGGPPLLGAVPRDALPTLPSRHLGLVTADSQSVGEDVLDQLANACREHVDVDELLKRSTPARGDRHVAAFRASPLLPSPGPWPAPPGTSAGAKRLALASGVRLGVARDNAFHFYYPDNLETLAESGAKLVPFSPLTDQELPRDLDALYFGGGYPELHAAELARNAPMLAAVRDFAASDRPVYAECGGLMYLGRSLATLDGRRHAMAGVLPLDTAMLPRLKSLGYAEAEFTANCLWGGSGQTCRGHEFHYSEITGNAAPPAGWLPAYTIRRRGGESRSEGFARKNVLASYVHLHWASRPDAVAEFLSHCKAHP
jgi:cobyrinic acid a,c-diamide synthase